jgi:hypothetical protein
VDPDIPDFKDRESFDADERELCADGSCTGLIGADGKCKVCGRSNDSKDAADWKDERSAAASPSDDAGDSAFADDDRQLCPDGACTGLLGSDGKCKVCGRSAAS